MNLTELSDLCSLITAIELCPSRGSKKQLIVIPQAVQKLELETFWQIVEAVLKKKRF